jgi:hypothetical protein
MVDEPGGDANGAEALTPRRSHRARSAAAAAAAAASATQAPRSASRPSAQDTASDLAEAWDFEDRKRAYFTLPSEERNR